MKKIEIRFNLNQRDRNNSYGADIPYKIRSKNGHLEDKMSTKKAKSDVN